MNILSIDTSSHACSVAIEIDGECHEDFRIIPRQHNQQLLPMVDKILKDHELNIQSIDLFSFCHGPGSFTGIRLASSVIQAFALAQQKPVVPISTLLTMAQTAYRIHQVKHVLVYLDARMDEVYWAECNINDAGLMEYRQSDVISRASDIALKDSNDVVVVCDNAALIKENTVLTNLECIDDFYPHAIDTLPFAKAAYEKSDVVSAAEALPAYLRQVQYRKVK